MLRSLLSAFLMYSRIPVPQVEWKPENRRYALGCFPLIGVVIGGLLVLWRLFCTKTGCGQLLFAGGAVCLPLLVTGGIHLDGYADVVDAKRACADLPKRLAILHDPHIGAFGVIYVGLYLVLQMAVFSEIISLRQAAAAGFGFVLSRILSALTSLYFRSAGQGSLYSFVQPADKRISAAILIVLLLGTAVGLFCVKPLYLLCLPLAGLLCLLYRADAYRNFGGVTGDTAGYFLQLCELLMQTVCCFIH